MWNFRVEEKPWAVRNQGFGNFHSLFPLSGDGPGFMLLGGRAADLVGRRRTLVTGIAVIGISSLTGGFAGTSGVLTGPYDIAMASSWQGIGAPGLACPMAGPRCSA